MENDALKPEPTYITFLVSILQTAYLWANTVAWFRELSFSRLECGVHDSYTFQCVLVGSFTSPGIDTR